MPIGMSRFGFFASCAAVDTASKPMNAKNTTPAGAEDAHDAAVVVRDALRRRRRSSAAGMYGVWFAGLMKPQPITMTRRRS